MAIRVSVYVCVCVYVCVLMVFWCNKTEVWFSFRENSIHLIFALIFY